MNVRHVMDAMDVMDVNADDNLGKQNTVTQPTVAMKAAPTVPAMETEEAETKDLSFMEYKLYRKDNPGPLTRN